MKMRHKKHRKMKTILLIWVIISFLYTFTTVWFYTDQNMQRQPNSQTMQGGVSKVIHQEEVNISQLILQIRNGDAKATFKTPDEEYKTRCQYGYFRLPGMLHCHPWLNCSNLKTDIASTLLLTSEYSFAKTMHLGLYKEHKVVVSTINPTHYGYASVESMMEFQPSEHIVQLVGSCNYTYVTQYHPYGDPRDLKRVFQLRYLMSRNNLKTRFQMCVSYIEVIHHLHTMPGGPRVFCDSPNLPHTLTQFLITDDLRLVLADLDYLYHANSKQNKTTRCSPIVLFKVFNPPESFTKPRAIDERSDVWKIPEVCDHFIGIWNTSDILQGLSNIRSRCKESNPSRRPTSGEVLSAYRQVLLEVMKNT